MKIMFNCLTMEKGGAERVISLLANEFSRKNDVSILTLKKSKDAYKLNPKIKRLKVDETDYRKDSRARSILRKLSLIRLARQRNKIIMEKPDIIISFLPEPSLRLMMIKKYSKKIRKIPTIISIRNDPEREFNNPLLRKVMKKLYKSVDGMVYQTDDAKKFFDNIVTTKNKVIIQNPIDDSILEEPKPDGQRKNVIINVGRLEPQKNQELLIKAFYDVLENNECDYVLEIYGEGSERKKLQSMIDGLGMRDRIVLKGQVDDIAGRLNNSKIFVLSSIYEGMPNALMEAMAMGLPCISTDCPCGGPRSLINNNINGILINNNSQESLSKAMQYLISNKDIRVKLSKNAVVIRKTNGIDENAVLWYKIIRNILGVKNNE